MKVCGVAVAMLQGHSWAPTPSNGSRVNVGTIPAVPSPASSHAGRREGPSSADAAGMGRRTRSSPRPGKPATWRRGPAGSQHQCATRRSPVNTGAPWPDLDEAEQRVLVMQTQAAPMGGRAILAAGSMTCTTSSMTRRSSSWRGTGCGATRVHERLVSMGSLRAPSSSVRRSCSAELREDLKARPVRSRAGAGEGDPQGDGQGPSSGDPDRRRPGRAGRVEAGARADLRGGLQAVFLRLPPEAPSPGRDRRDPLPRFAHSELRVGVRGGHQGVLRRDRPHGPDGPGATIGSGTSASWAGEGVPAGRDPHRGRVSTGTRSPAHPKAGSSHRCWPTSPCPSWTSTSPPSGRRSARTGHAPSVAAPAARP